MVSKHREKCQIYTTKSPPTKKKMCDCLSCVVCREGNQTNMSKRKKSIVYIQQNPLPQKKMCDCLSCVVCREGMVKKKHPNYLQFNTPLQKMCDCQTVSCVGRGTKQTCPKEKSIVYIQQNPLPQKNV